MPTNPTAMADHAAGVRDPTNERGMVTALGALWNRGRSFVAWRKKDGERSAELCFSIIFVLFFFSLSQILHRLNNKIISLCPKKFFRCEA